MHGEFSPPEIWEEYAVIKGNAPALLLGEYQKSVSAYTSGRGSLVCRAGKYAECANSERVIAEIGYDADSDLANSADSIFCANGAGYTVKWNEVESCAHVSSERSTAQKQKGSENYTAHTAYTGSFYSDEELMAIFERTYGKINRDKRTALYTPKEMDYQPKIKAKPVPKGDEHIFVDGYNMIFAWDELKSSAAKNLDLARSQLVNRLCSYQGFRQYVLTLVFDGYRVKGGVGSEEYPHNITVIYTKEGETADTYIQKAVYELADKNKDYRIRVASSDNLEQLMVSGSGAVRISAEEFHSEVAAVERAIHEVTR
ncbi:MAG: NYN domain-containing protein [Oscillospiraceae bacterium]|nr:NYN domain-containing protein [Oscillospiraceae bacterium]